MHIAGHEAQTICGAEDRIDLNYESPADFESAPQLNLQGQDLDLESYYTLILSNPDDMIPVGPIIHYMVGNIKGSVFVEGDFSTADTIFDFFAPNPPKVGGHAYHYCYLVYKQAGVEDFADVAAMSTERFPVQQVADDHDLTLLTSNYFSAIKGSKSFDSIMQ